jgi:uncharacterized membrane protein YecN with MAPEG domain
MTVFFICAGILGLMAGLLTLHIGRMRGKKKIFLGDGGDPEMTAAIRAHGNLLELTPLTLLLIYVAHGPYGPRLVAILSVLLVIARLFHAGGMLGFIPSGRVIGAVSGTILIIFVSVMLILAALRVGI